MNEPVNIILFKGIECAPCKPVERHLKRIVETSQGGARLTTIVTDEHPDIASKYGVFNVPHVLYNNEVCLTAQQAASMFSNFGFEETSMFSPSSQDLFNYLFNKLIEAGVKSSEADRDRWTKLSIITVSERLLNVEELEDVTRKSIGDYVHIGYLQSIVTSLLAINPLAKSHLFHSGTLAGKFGAAQSWIHKYNPRIMSTPRLKSRFKELLKGLRILYGPNQRASNVASDLDIIYIDDYHAQLQVHGSAHAVMNSEIGQDVCCFLAGEISGLLEVTLGETAAVVETKCWGLEDNYCEFDIQLGEESDHYKASSVKTKEFFSKTDRLRFELSLASISRNMYESVLNKRPMRPGIGDFIHISNLQHILTSLKFADPFNSTLLAYAGQHYGQILEDVGIISRIMKRRNLNYGSPMEFPQACEILGYYFNNMKLTRIQDEVTVEMIDDESAIFKVWESAATSGIDLSTVDLSALFPGVEKPPKINTMDDFMAGFINGRFDLLVEDEVIVKETKCQASGHECCEFLAALD